MTINENTSVSSNNDVKPSVITSCQKQVEGEHNIFIYLSLISPPPSYLQYNTDSSCLGKNVPKHIHIVSERQRETERETDGRIL